jgi:ABC-type antimicrobial peptide transport system permease subunit
MAAQLLGDSSVQPRWSLARYEHVDNAVQLYGLSTLDPLAIAISAAGVLAALALVSAYLPAARAARVDPLRALRHD